MFLALMQKIGHSYVFEWAVMALIEVEGYVNLPHTNMYLCSLCIFFILFLRYYAGWADKNHGKTIPVSK